MVNKREYEYKVSGYVAGKRMERSHGYGTTHYLAVDLQGLLIEIPISFFSPEEANKFDYLTKLGDGVSITIEGP